MDRQLIDDACQRAVGFRLVSAARVSEVARVFPHMYFTTVREYMDAQSCAYPHPAVEAISLGMRPYLISDDRLLVYADPFIPVLSVGIEAVRRLKKWSQPDELIPVMCPAGALLVHPDTLLSWL